MGRTLRSELPNRRIDAIVQSDNTQRIKNIAESSKPIPYDRDTPLTRPMADWDRQDKRRPTDGRVLCFPPLGDRYDEIDWSS
jgi:hypothetical protein